MKPTNDELFYMGGGVPIDKRPYTDVGQKPINIPEMQITGDPKEEIYKMEGGMPVDYLRTPKSQDTPTESQFEGGLPVGPKTITLPETRISAQPEMERVKAWLANHPNAPLKPKQKEASDWATEQLSKYSQPIASTPTVTPITSTVTPITPPQDPDAKALYDHVMTLSKVRNDS